MRRYHYEACLDNGKIIPFDTVADSEPEANVGAFQHFRAMGVTDMNARAVDLIRTTRAYLGDE
jgi:hypothetical protein